MQSHGAALAAARAAHYIDLAEGSHSVEVRKDGYRTYTRSIQVRRGETVTLNVSLTAGGGDR